MRGLLVQPLLRLQIREKNEEDHGLRNRARGDRVRVRNDNAYDRGLFGDIAFNGVSLFGDRADAAACEKELSGVYFGVFGDLFAQFAFQPREIFRYPAVYRVFRTSPARQRIAAQIQGQPLGRGVRQSRVVRRGDVSDLEIRFRNDHVDRVRG